MTRVNLKKIIHKTELQAIIAQLTDSANSQICIQQANGKILMGKMPENDRGDCRYPILLAENSIGWVIGEQHSEVIASIISYAAQQEFEKKSLANELLEKYQEIDLFQDISNQVNASLDLHELSQFVIEAAVNLLESTQGYIFRVNSSIDQIDILSAVGEGVENQQLSVLGKTLIENIMAGHQGEIINNITADSRFQIDNFRVSSLVCVPLKTKEKIVGVIAVGSETEVNYTTEHLKGLMLLASQAATAIEKALLYKKSCKAAQKAQKQAEKLQQALQKLQQTQAQLVHSEKMSSLGQMVAGIAHEINNPVNFIHGNLRYLYDYTQDLLNLVSLYQEQFPESTTEIKEIIEEIEFDFLLTDLPKLLSSMKIGTDRIKDIVVSLRNFSHLGKAEKTSIDIHQGIESTLLILNSRLKAKNSQTEVKVIKNYGNVPAVECYAGQLNQVLMNIISNAIDAMEESNQQRQASIIQISTQVVNSDWVAIRIKDNGPGIPEDVIQKIYDPFFTTKPIGKGTGLGMAISHQIIVEKHRGILECVSQPGEGTEFLIQIPIKISHLEKVGKVVSLESNELASVPV
ncbi:MAG: ATP-binding protein [Microcoleaceae cyanobacterium]